MDDQMTFLLGLIAFVLLLAAMGAVADWLGEPERRESRRRNGR